MFTRFADYFNSIFKSTLKYQQKFDISPNCKSLNLRLLNVNPTPNDFVSDVEISADNCSHQFQVSLINQQQNSFKDYFMIRLNQEIITQKKIVKISLYPLNIINSSLQILFFLTLPKTSVSLVERFYSLIIN